MKYRLYGKDGITPSEHQKLVDLGLIKKKELQLGDIKQKIKVKKKVLKKWTNSETGEMMQRISEKSGSNDSAYTSKTLNQYIYNDDEDFLRANSGF
jgi:hypothetical protein